MRVRRTWLSALGAVVVLAGCGSEDAGSSDPAPPPPITSTTQPLPPSTTNAPPGPTFVETFANELRTFYEQLVPAAAGPLICPRSGRLPGYPVSSEAPGSVTGCIGDDGSRYTLRARNLTAVPETLYFSDLIRTVGPGQTVDVPLGLVRSGNYIRFAGDVRAAVTSLTLDYFAGKVQSRTYAWRTCAQQLTFGCLTSNLADALGGRVLEVGRFRVPVGNIVSAISTVWSQGALFNTLTRRLAGQPTDGRLLVG